MVNIIILTPDILKGAISKEEEELRDRFFLRIGSTLALDYLYMFLGTFLAFAGFILNWISFKVFRSIRVHNQILREYLIVYTFASFVNCFIYLFSFLAKSPRLISFSLTYWVSFFRCKVIAWNMTLSFFLNLLDFCILFERISYFRPNLKRFVSHRPYVACGILFVAVNFINVTNILVEDPRTAAEYQDAINNQTKYPTYRYCKFSAFTKSHYGKILMAIVVTIKHFFTLFVELVMSVYSIVLFRQFVKEKAEYFKKRSNDDNISSSDESLPSISNLCTQISHEQFSADTPFYRLILYNSRLTKMTIYLTICSLFSHTAILLASALFVREEETVAVNYCYVAILVFHFLKHISNFILFYRFNPNFRKYLTNSFRGFIIRISYTSEQQ